MAMSSTAGCPSVVDSISDDLLTEILLRLPCPACLAKAAAVCTRFRRTIRCAAFLRRISSDHPLFCPGFFLADYGFPLDKERPLFEPLGPYCGAHFPLDFLGPDEKPNFLLLDCSGGLLLLLSCSKVELGPVVCEPVTRRYVTLPPLPLPPWPRNYDASKVIADVDADGSLFSQVVCAVENDVFFHRAGDAGWDKIELASSDQIPTWTSDKVLPRNSFFLLMCEHALLIDTGTREIFKVSISLLTSKYRGLHLVVLEDERTCCIVALREHQENPSETELHLWRLGDGEWVFWIAIPLRSIAGAAEFLLPELPKARLFILDARNGFVFLMRTDFWKSCPHLVIAIRLKTKQSFNLSFKLWNKDLYFVHNRVHPYWMVWLRNLQAQN